MQRSEKIRPRQRNGGRIFPHCGTPRGLLIVAELDIISKCISNSKIKYKNKDSDITVELPTFNTTVTHTSNSIERESRRCYRLRFNVRPIQTVSGRQFSIFGSKLNCRRFFWAMWRIIRKHKSKLTSAEMVIPSVALNETSRMTRNHQLRINAIRQITGLLST